jgi:hypothetical protein
VLIWVLLQRLLVHVHYMVYELRRRNPMQLTLDPNGGGTTSPSGYDTSYAGLGALDSEGVQHSGLVVKAQHCGARLLQWLHDRKAHGEPLLRTCTQRLMWHVYQIFFNQLTTWCVFQAQQCRGELLPSIKLLAWAGS